MKQIRTIFCSPVSNLKNTGILLFFLIFLSLSFISASSFITEIKDPGLINDGPYIFLEGENFRIKWIENSEMKEGEINYFNYDEFKTRFDLLNNFYDLYNTFLISPRSRQIYNRVDSIGVITDIHGEYEIYINLLINNGIIDTDLNWKFGKGHLVVLGDVFDRGDNVTEVFWHLFGLEKQAARAGGRVHFLLGNHELMVLGRVTGYISPKYRSVENISGRYYCDLYTENSVLGKWLRTKPVIISINDILFVHAGLSIEMMYRDMKPEKINRLFSNYITGKNHADIIENDELNFLSDEYGPVWYRGYYTDKSFCESKVDSILSFYEKKHIVTGHTVIKEIVSLFNNRIFCCDTGIMHKQPGEMLLYKGGTFYRGLSNGRRIMLN